MVLDLPLLDYGNEDVLANGGLPMMKARQKIRADQVPRLRKALIVRVAKDCGVLVSKGGSGGSVIEKDELRAPGESGGMGREEHEIDGGNEGLRPLLDGTERCSSPIKGTDQIGHDISAEDSEG